MTHFQFHDYYEIIFLQSEKGCFFVNEKIYPLQFSNVFVFNTMDFHRSVISGEHQSCVIHFSPDLTESLSTQKTNLLACFRNRPKDFCHCIQLSLDQQKQLFVLLEKAESISKSISYGSDIARQLIMAEILIYLNPLFLTVRRQNLNNSSLDFARIKPIIEYIQENIAQDISLDFLSSKFFISKYHLGHLFKEVTGYPVMEYVIHRRIILARQLLHKNYSVQKTGELIGFNDNSHFIRTFKNIMGVSPGQYKKIERI